MYEIFDSYPTNKNIQIHYFQHFVNFKIINPFKFNFISKEFNNHLSICIQFYQILFFRLFQLIFLFIHN